MNSSSAPGAVFQIINPVGGEIYKLGSTVGIFWTGGDPAGSVTHSLVDYSSGYVVGLDSTDPLLQSKPNNGFFKWSFPTNLPIDPTHDYQFFIEATTPDPSGQVNHTYGYHFKLAN